MRGRKLKATVWREEWWGLLVMGYLTIDEWDGWRWEGHDGVIMCRCVCVCVCVVITHCPLLYLSSLPKHRCSHCGINQLLLCIKHITRGSFELTVLLSHSKRSRMRIWIGGLKTESLSGLFCQVKRWNGGDCRLVNGWIPWMFWLRGLWTIPDQGDDYVSWRQHIWYLSLARIRTGRTVLHALEWKTSW